ncbi:hypothetical protein [Acidisoma sp. 7E03]
MSLPPVPTPHHLRAELEAGENHLKEWVCPACDWIGSPDEEPVECPRCGGPDLETITHD